MAKLNTQQINGYKELESRLSKLESQINLGDWKLALNDDGNLVVMYKDTVVGNPWEKPSNIK